jgi:peptidoglycan pentaglycine glycine transferase (the first glycine)
MPSVTLQDWTEFYEKHPGAHLLQSPAWGQLKASYGWEPVWIVREGIGAQLLFQKLPLGYQIAYLPRGPLGVDQPGSHPRWEAFQSDMDQICRERRAVFLKIEADLWEDEGCAAPPGFRISSHSIQPPRTILVSLHEPEEVILERMKSKTRYNIRLAAKKGVTVRSIDDVGIFYHLLEHTSERSEFGIHTREYYRRTYALFHQRGECQLFVAEYQEKPLASIMVFARGERCWYFYGASSREHSDLMPTYLVQWEAMRWAKRRGCRSYDLWGVPDQEESILEEDFTSRSDGLWGVYRFKRGFGGDLKRSCGPWDKAYHPLLYTAYLARARLTSEGG